MDHMLAIVRKCHLDTSSAKYAHSGSLIEISVCLYQELQKS